MTGSSPAADMLAFGEVVSIVVEQSSERDSLIAELKADDPNARLTAAQALDHPFFAPVFAWRREEIRKCCVMASEMCQYGRASCKLCQGMECADLARHFVCDECLEAHVLHSIDAPPCVHQQREGRVYCPKYPHECGGCAFADADLARHVSASTYEKYVSVRISLLQRKKVEEA